MELSGDITLPMRLLAVYGWFRLFWLDSPRFHVRVRL